MSELMKRIATSLSKEASQRKKKAQPMIEDDSIMEESKPVHCLDSIYEALAEGDCDEAKEHVCQLARELGLADQVSFEVSEDDSEESEDVEEPADSMESEEEGSRDHDASMYKTSKY